MQSQILEIVNEKHKASNGKCGTYLPEIAIQLKTNVTEVKKVVSELASDNKLRIRTGINGDLIMKK